jgi:predicted nucleic acid-binding protein
MNDIVVDASIVVKWVLPELDSKQAARLFNDVVGQGGRLLVLDLGLVEAANAVWKKGHRKLVPPDEVRRLVRDLLAIPVQIQPANKLLTAALEIAVKHDRTIYDALFVALARDLRLPGVTADEPLWQAVHADFPNVVLLRDWR